MDMAPRPDEVIALATCDVVLVDEEEIVYERTDRVRATGGLTLAQSLAIVASSFLLGAALVLALLRVFAVAPAPPPVAPAEPAPVVSPLAAVAEPARAPSVTRAKRHAPRHRHGKRRFVE
jgi:hypothetical protein